MANQLGYATVVRKIESLFDNYKLCKKHSSHTQIAKESHRPFATIITDNTTKTHCVSSP